MFKIKTKKVKNHLPNLLKRLEEINRSKVEVGYFVQQGMHSTANLTYPNLFALLSWGSPSTNMPARPILDYTFKIYHPPKTNDIISDGLRKFLSRIDRKSPPIKFSKILKKIGGDYVQKTRAGFGDITKIAENAEYTQALKAWAGVKPNNPLIWHGELRDKLSYSIDGINVITPT